MSNKVKGKFKNRFREMNFYSSKLNAVSDLNMSL